MGYVKPCFFIVAIVTLPAANMPLFAVTPYTVTDLGPLPGGFHTTGYGINSFGQVAGVCTLSVEDRAVRWTDAAPRDLGSWGSWSKAYEINDFGAVVGAAQTSSWPPDPARAFIWTESSGMQHLDNVLTPPGQSSEARAINNHGAVVGSTAIEGTMSWHAFLWENNQMRDLGFLAEGAPSYANDVNNDDLVVGRAGLAEEGLIHAMSWTEDEGMVDLKTLGGRQSDALGVNDDGDIVGWSSLDDFGTFHAFLYRDGVMHDLGVLGGLYSEAHAINNRAQVVGITHDASENWVPALWESGAWYDLNHLIPPDSGWTLLGANDINDAGMITGVGCFDDAYMHAFLLKPVPEPGLWAMTALGALCVFIRKWCSK